MMHPDTDLRYINDKVGHGVVATRDIPKGTITWVQDKLDREFTPQQVNALGDFYIDILDKYCFRNHQGKWILCWDHSRFVNHSFRSNCLTTAYNFEVAVRDIKAGEELTDDYGYLNISDPFEALDEGVERKVVYPDDLTRYHGVWDEMLTKNWKHIPKVSQPLKHLISADLWSHIERIAAGREEMASILNCYYDEDAHASQMKIKSANRVRQSS